MAKPRAQAQELQVTKFGIDLAGGKEIIFDPLKVDFDHIDLVAEAVAEALEGELSSAVDKEDSESGELKTASDLKKKILKLGKKYVIQFFNILGKYQGWAEVSAADFSGVSYPILNDFLYNCFDQYDISLNMFFPKSVEGSVKKYV